MKKILFFVALMTTLICITFISANATSMHSVNSFTNRGKNSIAINNVINGENDFFVKLNDIKELNLNLEYIEGKTYSLGRKNGPLEYTIVGEEGRIEADKNYENAVILKNNALYLSATVLGDIFSYPEKTIVDFKKGIISLWINDYTTETYWATYEIDENVFIPEDGIEATLYLGTSRKTMISVGTGIPCSYPEKFEGIDTTYIPSDTDKFNMDYGHSINSSEIHTFYNDTRTKEVYFDKIVRQAYNATGGNTSSGGSPSGGPTSSAPNGYDTLGIKIDTDVCVGGTFEKVTNHITNVRLTLDDCFKPVIVSGTVTVPIRNHTIGYSIIAEGNNRSELTENGVYITERDFVTSVNGELGKFYRTIDYKLRLKPNQDYVVYVRFDDGYYVRQYALFDDLTEDKVQNFSDFEKSKSITGQLILPSDITSFTDVYGNDRSSAYCCLTLQGANAPYYVVQEIEVEITPDMDTVPFELFDDIGVENGIVSYRMYNNPMELYESAVYFDGTVTEFNAESASVISTDTKGIEFRMVKGKVVELVLRCDVGSDLNLFLAYDYESTTIDDFLTSVQGHLVDRIWRTDSTGYKATFNFIMPNNDIQNRCYIPFIEDRDCPDRLYCVNYRKWETNPETVYYIRESGSFNSSFLYSGYDPATPIDITYSGYSSDNEHIYSYFVDSLFGYDATIYVAYYGENDELLYTETKNQIFESYQVYELYFTLDKTYEPLAETIKMFVWTDKLRPLSNIVYMKPTK